MPPCWLTSQVAAVGLQDVEHGPGYGELVFEGERREFCEGAGHVERRRKQASLHFAAASLGIKKYKAIEKFDFVRSANAAIEIIEISATAEGDMLAIINVLPVRQNIRSCAAAEEGALLEEAYAPAGFSQRDAGRQTRQPAADHDHVFQECSLPSGA